MVEMFSGARPGTNPSLSAISITYEKEKSTQNNVIAKDAKSLFQIYEVVIIIIIDYKKL